jgi:hypothetical protein
MKTTPLLWWLLPLSLATLTCTREYIEDLQEVCFERDVLPIFQSNCLQSGWHNSQDRREGYDLTTYDRIVSRGIEPGNYKSSKIYEVLVVAGGDPGYIPMP